MNGLLQAYRGAVAGPWIFTLQTPKCETLPERFLFLVGSCSGALIELDSLTSPPSSIKVEGCAVTVRLTPEQVALLTCDSYSYALYGINADGQRVAVADAGRGKLVVSGAL